MIALLKYTQETWHITCWCFNSFGTNTDLKETGYGRGDQSPSSIDLGQVRGYTNRAPTSPGGTAAGNPPQVSTPAHVFPVFASSSYGEACQNKQPKKPPRLSLSRLSFAQGGRWGQTRVGTRGRPPGDQHHCPGLSPSSGAPDRPGRRPGSLWAGKTRQDQPKHPCPSRGSHEFGPRELRGDLNSSFYTATRSFGVLHESPRGPQQALLPPPPPGTPHGPARPRRSRPVPQAARSLRPPGLPASGHSPARAPRSVRRPPPSTAASLPPARHHRRPG